MFALRRLGVLVLLSAEIGCVIALQRLGSVPPFALPVHHLGSWLRTAPPADAFAALLRLVALLGAWWLLLGTVLYVGACITRLPTAMRAARWATVPAVRRVVDGALAASLVAGSLLGPAAAHAADDPPATSVRDGRSGGLASLPAEPAPASPPSPGTPRSVASLPVSAPPVAPAPVAPAAAERATVVVAPGDNLWELAATQLARATGRERGEVGDAEIAPYWVAVCEHNRGGLRSGDPNLIYPGELVSLPPIG